MSRPACTDPVVLEQRKQKRREKNARYRAKNRAALAEKQVERIARLKAQDKPGTLAKLDKYRRASMERNPELRKKAAAAAKARYHTKKHDPEFRAENSRKVQEWYRANKPKALIRAAEYRRKREREDINFRITLALRRRLWMALRGGGSRSLKHLGCSIEYLRSHLTSLFTDGMSWENYGQKGWHIDHIRPLSSFDLTDQAQLAQACHYSNLQPLWAFDNISKGARLIASCPMENAA